MLPLPLPATDSLRLADWLELNALLAEDRNYSTADLGRALQAAGVLVDQSLELESERGAIERVCLDVFREVEARALAAGSAYPFALTPSGLVEVSVAPEVFSAYTFCLCLAYWGEAVRTPGLRPRRLFEDLATLAAKNYLGGESIRFASPRAELPRGFTAALGEVCKRMGEGKTRRRSVRASKDAGLDVVAWRNFPDQLPGKLILFGQCASGRDWEEKLRDLEPADFCGAWLAEQPASRAVKAFFTPHRVDPLDWEDVNRAAGLFFDRCRLSYWAHNATVPADPVPYITWSRQVLHRQTLREAS